MASSSVIDNSSSPTTEHNWWLEELTALKKGHTILLDGIRSFESDTKTQQLCLHLIEGHSLQVEASCRGYTLMNEERKEVYESLHALLLAKSGLYQQRFHQETFRQLENLSQQQQVEEYQEVVK